jgi:hypothetical protein
MGTSNRVQIASVRETTPGTTPTTPRMRLVRATSESLDFTPDYVDSDELRSDRMLGAPIEVMQAGKGAINFELSFPDDNSPLSDYIRSALFSTWTNTNSRDNDGTADSVITDVATLNTIVTVVTGTALVAGELYRFSGFGVSGNNGIFKCTTGSATVPRFVGSGITDEAVPPAAARIKCVGLQGAAGDITAAAGGLASTVLDFTTIPGLVAGKWIKVGGTAAGDQFPTAANNAWIRITAVAAHALTCDNLPAGWAVDAAAAKTIKVWFGDYIRNGVTATAQTIEKGFLDQTVPTYIVNTGMQVNNFSLNLASKQKITGTVDFLGMGGSQSTVALDAAPDAQTTGLVMAANANVGRIAENNATLTSPNWAQSFSIKLANNLRSLESVDSTSPVGINPGQFTAGGQINTYFGDNSLLAKLYNSTSSSISSRVTKSSQAILFTFPTVYLRGGGNPQAGGKNQDVMTQFDWSAAYNATYNCSCQIDRHEYFE